LGFWRIVISSGLGVSRKEMMREIISVGRVRRVMVGEIGWICNTLDAVRHSDAGRDGAVPSKVLWGTNK